MILYDYKCSCGNIEEFPSMDGLPKCSKCEETMERVYAIPHLTWTQLPGRSGKRFGKSAYMPLESKERMAADDSDA